MGNEDKDIKNALNQFKDTLDDLKKENMYDEMVGKYEKEKKEQKKNPFQKKND